MPTYQYRCKDCENELEAVQGFHDDPLTECPSCGGTLRKKFGSVGISFKGSGFYKNDSRGGSGTKSTEPASTSSESSSPSTSTSSDGSSSSSSDSSSSSSNGSSDSGSKPAAAAAG
jgi:putative FmdB family regulatory protein